MKRKVLALTLAVCMTIGLCTGCGGEATSPKQNDTENADVENANDETGSDATAENGAANASGNYDTEITIDVFDSEANYQGLQTGWFAQIVKEKFNMNLNIIAPNVAGGGDTLFQTRSAAGDLGDLIICNTSNGKLAQLVKAGLVQDISPLMDGQANLANYKDAIESMSEIAGTDEGLYAIPTEVSMHSPDEPSVGLEPNYAPYIRWDYYKAVGYPEMENLDDLLNVLSDMQENARETEGTDDIYAFSLFKDWDRNMMTLARNVTCMYGYDEAGISLLANDGSDVQSPTADDSIYRQGLEFLYKANKMGLVDPDSTTQNYDTMYQKMQSGKVLFSFWSWMGQGAFNTPDNTAAGKGFKMAAVSDMKIGVNGCRVLGNHEIALMVGSKADDPQRIVDFIDWLYSPEGIMANQANGTSGACGPEGLTWEDNNGSPALTDFGKQALGGDEVDVPEEWGGGKWKEGVSALNVVLVNAVDTNPNNGQPYMYSLWESTIKDNATALDEDWMQQMGSSSAISYLEEHDMLEIAAGDSFVAPEEDSQYTNLRSQCGASLTDYSWRLSFADNDETFDSLYKEMQDTLAGLDFEKLFDYDKSRAMDRVNARKEILEKY